MTCRSIDKNEIELTHVRVLTYQDSKMMSDVGFEFKKLATKNWHPIDESMDESNSPS